MNFTIGLARREHLPQLPGIERDAATMFTLEDLPAPHRLRTTPHDDLEVGQQSGLLWVASDASRRPIGFLLSALVDHTLHIREMDVRPERSRQGVGTLLISTLARAARARGCRRITLPTFEHLPWNAPFYAKCGFSKMPADTLDVQLAAILEREAGLGLKRRIAMECILT